MCVPGLASDKKKKKNAQRKWEEEREGERGWERKDMETKNRGEMSLFLMLCIF
jgi:hypothetical protein